MKNNEYKKHSKDVSRIIQKALKQGIDEIPGLPKNFEPDCFPPDQDHTVFQYTPVILMV